MYLFVGTVVDNIRYGKPEATREEIIAVVQKANAYAFITALSDGYDIDIGQRRNLDLAGHVGAPDSTQSEDHLRSHIDGLQAGIVKKCHDQSAAPSEAGASSSPEPPSLGSSSSSSDVLPPMSA